MIKRHNIAQIVCCAILFMCSLHSRLHAASNIADLSGKVVTRMVYDAPRNVVCAISTASDSVLFIDAATMTVSKSLYIGKAPRDLDIDITGTKLYVSSDGQSPGVPGSALIAEIDLATQTLSRSIPLPITYWSSEVTRAMHIKAGRAGRLYYDGGFMGSGNGGNARLLNLDTGLDIAGLEVIKTNMVMSPDRNKLYGQYVYTPNLGEMGVFNVSTDTTTKIGTNRYPPYPYGWSGDNPYVISSDGTKLIYDNVLFNAANITQVYGNFTENIYALNASGKFAVGNANLWDSTTLGSTGNATRLASLPFTTTVMMLTPDDTLYLYNPSEIKLYKVKLFSTTPVPPIAQDDAYSCVGTSLSMAAAKGLLANDSDLNFEPITAEINTQPSHGTVAINANGSFTYTPTAGYSGMDSFTYKSKDATSFSTANVSVSVTPMAITGVNPASGLGGTALTNVVINGGGFVNSTVPTVSGAVAFNGHNYLYVSTGMSWTDANTYCNNLLGHLVTITSAAENTFVLNLNTANTKWIGLNDTVTEGTFAWVNGDPLSYTNWSSSEPNNSGGNEDYGQQYTSGAWNDASGTEILPCVCEFEPLPPVVTLTHTGTTINAKNVRVNSISQLTFDVSLAGASIGTWDVNVTDVDSGTTVTLPGGFQVTLVPTTVTVGNVAAAGYKSVAQTIALSATVTPQVGTLSAGNVTFQIKNGNTNVGTAVTSATLNNGATGNVNYTLPAGLAPGTYTVSATYNPAATYLGSTDTSKQLVVAPAVLTVTPASFTRYYGTPNPTLTGTVASVQSGDGITVTYSTTALTASPPGDFPITATLSDPNNKLSNYTVTLNSATLTVNKAPLSVTAANNARQVGTANPPLTGTIIGVKLNDNITASYTTTATPQSPEGLYPIVPVVSDPDGKLVYYNLVVTNGTLTVGNTPVLTVTAGNATRSYGTPNPTLTGSVTGIQNNDNITVIYTTIATAGSPVGTYPIIPTLVDPDNKLVNYIVVKNNGTLTVTIAPPIVVTPDAVSRSFGVPNPTLTGSLTGVLNGDAITATYSCSATQTSPPGQYVITATLLDPGNKLSNYTSNINSAFLTVTRAPLALTGGTITRVYGAPPAATGTLVGVKNGDNITATYATDAVAGSNVGTYTIVPSVVDPGNKLGNYDLSIVNGTLTVVPKTLTVTANSLTRAYGNPVANYNGTISGLFSSDLITASYSCTATAASPVGTYAIVPALSDPSDRLSNYNVNPVNGTLTIIKAPAIVVTASNATRNFGAPNPAFTGLLSGVLNGDNLSASFTTPAQPGSPVGIYPIVAGLNDPDSKAGNYNVVLNNAQLNILPAPLTVSGPSLTRSYHQPNPELSATIVGAAAGDVFQTTCSTTATSDSPAGTYAITVQLSDPNNRLSNYTPAINAGKLIVTPAKPAILWPAPAPIVAGVPLGTAQLNAMAFDSVTAAPLSGIFTYNPTAGTGLIAGTGQSLSLTFTPSDTNYAPIVASTLIDVLAAEAPHITSALTASAAAGEALAYTFEAGGSAPIQFKVFGLPDGLTFDGKTISGTVGSSGQFNVMLTASNFAGSDTKVLHISIVGSGENRAPVFASAPTASANPAAPGSPVSFTASATDADADILGYTWDFGDGTTDVGEAVSKTYDAPGIYVVTLTVSDGRADVTQTLNLLVQGEEPAGNFVVQRVSGTFVFSKKNADTLTVSGQIPLSASFNPEGKIVRVLIGGIDNTYTLKAKASAPLKDFVLKSSKKGVAPFVFSLKKSSLFDPLSGLGFSKTGSAKVPFPVIIVLDGINYFDSLSVDYSVKSQKAAFSGSQK